MFKFSIGIVNRTKRLQLHTQNNRIAQLLAQVNKLQYYSTFDKNYGLTASSSDDKPIKKRRPKPIDPQTQGIFDLAAQFESSAHIKPVKEESVNLKEYYLEYIGKNNGLNEIEDLVVRITKAFDKAQMKKYILDNIDGKFKNNKWTKKELVYWILEKEGVRVRKIEEMKEEKEMEVEIIDKVEEEFQSSKKEIYFLICKGGENLRNLELLGNSDMEINLELESYIIRGSKKEIEKTQKLIKELMNFTTLTIDITSLYQQDNKFIKKNAELLAAIAHTTGTYITVSHMNNGQQLCLTGLNSREIKQSLEWIYQTFKLNHNELPKLDLYYSNRKNTLYQSPIVDSIEFNSFFNNFSMFQIKEDMIEEILEEDKYDITKKLDYLNSYKMLNDKLINKHNNLTLPEIFDSITSKIVRPGFEPKIIAKFGHSTYFNKLQFAQANYFDQQIKINNLKEQFDNNNDLDSYFINSFPLHKLREDYLKSTTKEYYSIEYSPISIKQNPFFINDYFNINEMVKIPNKNLLLELDKLKYNLNLKFKLYIDENNNTKIEDSYYLMDQQIVNLEIGNSNSSLQFQIFNQSNLSSNLECFKQYLNSIKIQNQQIYILNQFEFPILNQNQLQFQLVKVQKIKEYKFDIKLNEWDKEIQVECLEVIGNEKEEQHRRVVKTNISNDEESTNVLNSIINLCYY
ncbi:hypothetical protein K502DRAFT_344560 [Neoconidiobolus thromboides FSU 785]|nr:hypothetical protein K502DRAFT_344560 [Neoconidiobolus thromboides FSU 785]